MASPKGRRRKRAKLLEKRAAAAAAEHTPTQVVKVDEPAVVTTKRTPVSEPAPVSATSKISKLKEKVKRTKKDSES